MEYKIKNEDSYASKLKSPKWQKKRLEILDRDSYKCRFCEDEESTLHVHHISYSNGNPWDIDSNLLITLCESCHAEETLNIKRISSDFITMLKEKAFTSHEIFDLMVFLHTTDDRIRWSRNVKFFDALEYFLRKESNYKLIIDEHQDAIKRSREKRKKQKKLDEKNVLKDVFDI